MGVRSYLIVSHFGRRLTISEQLPWFEAEVYIKHAQPTGWLCNDPMVLADTCVRLRTGARSNTNAESANQKRSLKVRPGVGSRATLCS